MLTYHRIDELKGKVSTTLLNNYTRDYQNLMMSSIIAGFHRAYGIRNEGISMSMEIVNSISDDTVKLWERNILVWNLYILSRELIDDNEYDDALKYSERAEANWSRDVLLSDDLGVYHVSWVEQIWLRQAEIYLLIDNKNSFKIVCDKILDKRMNLFNKAMQNTGEGINKDRCTYSCLELMAYEKRKHDIKAAVSMIKQAVKHKGALTDDKFFIMFKEIDNIVQNTKLFDLWTKLYYKIPDSPFDNILYSYCKSCKHFNENEICSKFNIKTDAHKACSHFE
jgi:hypothetical protein